jgi:hypothetical protein
MNKEMFLKSIDDDSPPEDLEPYLAGLWHARHGDWDTAHELVQDETTAEAAWVHAYLHRVEGDNPNAAYWYNIAGKRPFTGEFEDEWHEMVSTFFAGS